MTVSWKTEYNPKIITEKLDNSKTMTSSSVKFQGFEFKEFEVLLYSMLKFPEMIPEIEGRRIVNQAIFNVGKKMSITPQNLLIEINKLEAEYSILPEKSYVLVTSLSLNRAISLHKLKLGNVTIQFESQLPKRYEKESAKLLTKAKHSLYFDIPNNYLFARVHVSARSIFEAAETSLNSIDLVRSIWNWFYNHNQFIRMSSGKRQPVNKIVSGPIHTLHKPSGELASESWWYDPNYHGIVQAHNLNQELDNLKKFYRDIRAMLARSKYRQILEEAIIRYGRALDDNDWNNAYLKLWSVVF